LKKKFFKIGRKEAEYCADLKNVDLLRQEDPKDFCSEKTHFLQNVPKNRFFCKICFPFCCTQDFKMSLKIGFSVNFFCPFAVLKTSAHF
jgi:hypothetical protein